MKNGLGLEWHEEVWLLENLKKFERNPRKISKSQQSILRKAIEKLGLNTINNYVIPFIMDQKKRIESLQKRFHSRYEIMPNGCWNWLGKKMPNGYGRINLGSKYQYAHRISWFLKHGEFPKQFACHKCDNRSCVNPDHLFEGNAKDNTTDAIRKNRLATGEKHGLTRITIDQAREIKSSSENQHKMAKRFGISQGQVSRIRRGLDWKFA